MTTNKKNGARGAGTPGRQSPTPTKEYDMSQSISSADARKYADYDVEIRESKIPVSTFVTDGGEVARKTTVARRVPSDKLFIVYIRSGVTPRESHAAADYAYSLPGGGWTRFPASTWFRMKAKNGQWFFQQVSGPIVDYDFEQLELEMMIDATTSTEVL